MALTQRKFKHKEILHTEINMYVNPIFNDGNRKKNSTHGNFETTEFEVPTFHK